MMFLTLSNVHAQSDEDRVKNVLMEYKSALESLDVSSTNNLFTTDSEVLESGSVEGTYQNYLKHHIGPELSQFKSFKYNDYKVTVLVAGEYAFSTETYVYEIILKEGDRVVERKGATTSVLQKENDAWKIMRSHRSSRAVRKP